jgi:hypothetical protein
MRRGEKSICTAERYVRPLENYVENKTQWITLQCIGYIIAIELIKNSPLLLIKYWIHY